MRIQIGEIKYNKKYDSIIIYKSDDLSGVKKNNKDHEIMYRVLSQTETPYQSTKWLS